jgi:hypothetical protein
MSRSVFASSVWQWRCDPSGVARGRTLVCRLDSHHNGTTGTRVYIELGR